MSALTFTFVASGQNAIVGAYRDIGSAAKKAGSDAENAAQRMLRVQEQAAIAGERAMKRAAKSSIKEEERRYREIEKYSQKAVRQFEKEADARVRAEQRATAKITAQRQATIGRIGGTVMRGLAGAAMTAGGLAMGMVGAAAREDMRVGEIANRVSINSRMPGQKAVSAASLKGEFESAAVANPGQKAEDIGLGVQKYVDLTGDLNTAREAMGSFATVASATGASVEDVATAAASMGKQFDIKKVSDLQSVFSVLTAQGKGGALTMKDMAEQMQKLAAAGRAFGVGEGVDGVAKIGGLMQIARAGTRSPQQAGTAVENIFGGLSNKQKQLSAIGVNTYDKSGKRRDIYELLPEIFQKSAKGGALKQDKALFDIFGKQGSRGVSTLTGTFREASAAAGGGEKGAAAGYAAVAEALKNAEKTATSWSEVQQDATQAQQNASAQLTAAWESIVKQVGSEVTPALVKLVPMLTQLAGSQAMADMIAGFGAVAEGAGIVARAFGLFKPKNKTPEEQFDTAVKAKEKFEASIKSPMEMTRAQVEERKRLQANVDAAEEVLRPKADAGSLSNANHVFQNFSPEQFADKYAAISGMSGPEAEGMHQLGAQQAKEIQDDPTGYSPAGNDAMKELEGQYASQIIQQKAAEAASKAETKAKEDAAKAATELATSLRAARDEVSRSKPLNDR